jgi:hypothetical protein
MNLYDKVSDLIGRVNTVVKKIKRVKGEDDEVIFSVKDFDTNELTLYKAKLTSNSVSIEMNGVCISSQPFRGGLQTRFIRDQQMLGTEIIDVNEVIRFLKLFRSKIEKVKFAKHEKDGMKSSAFIFTTGAMKASEWFPPGGMDNSDLVFSAFVLYYKE